MADTYPMPEHGWTCFHCGDTFTTINSARMHFGTMPDDTPGCVMKLTARDNEILWLLREKDAELWRYRQEDQPIMREIYAMGAVHSRALIAAEQSGYDKGLRDGQTLLPRQRLPENVEAEVRAALEGGMPQRECARRLGVSHARVRGVAKRMKEPPNA